VLGEITLAFSLARTQRTDPLEVAKHLRLDPRDFGGVELTSFIRCNSESADPGHLPASVQMSWRLMPTSRAMRSTSDGPQQPR
jgi:hypothetical protein